MIICIPVLEDLGLESPISAHFGSAPAFMLADTKTRTTSLVTNNNAHHVHGMCQPLAALDGLQFEAVVVGGIGAGALGKLQAAGVKVYRTTGGTVSDVIDAVESGIMQVMSLQGACGGHHGCSH
ncbi:NifB/NifX family molybdenum-iron cluster-binding protein [Myxococcota bacterium]|nr:NifB/NifX family molybdenum-iron cluster-binding protein [Myxococcota bacterium]